MKYGTLTKRHPCCDLGAFRRFDALYRGGITLRRIVGEFLPQNPMEPPKVYEARKNEAAYRSYVGPIVDAFSAQLFSSPFLVRTTKEGETTAADPYYAAFREDVDSNGTDLIAFMKSRFITAMVKGCAWILAEMPDEGDIPAESRLDWEARDLGHARLCAVEPDNVLDWECDNYGRLLWAITFKREMRRDDPRQERQLITETFKLYDQENVETFKLVYDPKKKTLKAEDDVPSIGVKPHGFPRVPLIEMRLPPGLWLLDRAAEAQVEHFRLSAAMSWAVRRCCFPMGVAKLASDESDIKLVGAGIFHKLGLEESIEWVAPDTAPFEVLAKEIEAQKDEIYRVAQMMAASVNNSAAGLTRSGESKEADKASEEICLTSYATHVREAIEETYELISDARGDTDIDFSIEGMNSFDLNDVTVTLANIQAAKNIGIPSPTLKKELAMKAADLLLPDASQEIKDLIREEIETSEERMPDMAPPLPGQDPNADDGSEEKSSDNGDGQDSSSPPNNPE